MSSPNSLTLKRSLVWMVTGQGSSVILQFAASVVLARYLTPHEMGIYAVAAAIMGTMAFIQVLGLHNFIVREKDLNREIKTSAFTINAVICVMLSLVTEVIAQTGSVFFTDAAVRQVLAVIAVVPLFGIFDLLPASGLEREGYFNRLSITTVTVALAYSTMVIVFAVAGCSYMSIVYAQVTCAFANTLILNVFGRRHVQFRLGLFEWRRVANFGFQMLAMSGVNALSGRLTELIIGRFLGLAAVGIYNRAGNLNGLVWNNIHVVLGRVLFVDFARLSRSEISLRDAYLRAVTMITALLWPAFAGLAILAGPILYRLYGEQWSAAAAPAALLSIASIIAASITMSWELFAAKGELKTQTRIEGLKTVASLILFVVLCPYGLVAAAVARVCDAVLAVWFYKPHLNRMTDTTSSDFIPIYSTSALLVACATLPSFTVMLTYHFDPKAPILPVAFSVLLGIVMWAAALIWLGHPLGNEGQKVLWRMRDAVTSRVLGPLRRKTSFFTPR